jgi:hypothetical protein
LATSNWKNIEFYTEDPMMGGNSKISTLNVIARLHQYAYLKLKMGTA